MVIVANGCYTPALKVFKTGAHTGLERIGVYLLKLTGNLINLGYGCWRCQIVVFKKVLMAKPCSNVCAALRSFRISERSKSFRQRRGSCSSSTAHPRQRVPEFIVIRKKFRIIVKRRECALLSVVCKSGGLTPENLLHPKRTRNLP